jgi:hypothetical protein
LTVDLEGFFLSSSAYRHWYDVTAVAVTYGALLLHLGLFFVAEGLSPTPFSSQPKITKLMGFPFSSTFV